jgi:glutaminyl-peptide cyclotransferase
MLARSLLLASCVLIPLVFIACPKNDVPVKPRVGMSTAPAKPGPTLAPSAVAFNADRAMRHVRKQLEIGPRPPGTPALEKTRNYIIEELKSNGLRVFVDEFTAKTPLGEKRMVNIIGDIPGESKDVILLASHYDTKLYDDMLFIGANDPAASVATLLEIGRVLGSSKEKHKLTYRLVFFDGEEALCEGWDECSKPDAPDNTYGSRRYVSQLKAQGDLKRTRGLILLDMIGYKKLELGRDPSSTRWLQDIIWQTGRELGHAKIFVDREEGVGGDDHEPFLAAGIDAVDLIQLNSYPHWHTPDDDIDKISADSMKIVGDTVLGSLPRIVAYILKNED